MPVERAVPGSDLASVDEDEATVIAVWSRRGSGALHRRR
jgi:hypothetical protein